jgi:hypothetical protein
MKCQSYYLIVLQNSLVGWPSLHRTFSPTVGTGVQYPRLYIVYHAASQLGRYIGWLVGYF